MCPNREDLVPRIEFISDENQKTDTSGCLEVIHLGWGGSFSGEDRQKLSWEHESFRWLQIISGAAVKSTTENNLIKQLYESE